MARFDQDMLQLKWQSVTSYLIFSSIKNLPTSGISANSVRQCSRRVPFLGTEMSVYLRSRSTDWRFSERYGRYLCRKVTVNQRRTADSMKARALNIVYDLIIDYRVVWNKRIKEEGGERWELCYHQMYREQVYNSMGWEDGMTTPSLQTSRRPHPGNHRSTGLLNRSRNSNHSNSIRLKRTQVSNDRINNSRDRELNSQQTSGITYDGYNENVRRLPRAIGSVLSLSRRRPGQSGARIPAASSKTGRNIVENLYMLTNNTPQYAQQPQRGPQYQQQYSSRTPYQKQQRYERIADRRPQHVPQRKIDRDRYPERSPDRYPEVKSQRYIEPKPQRYPSTRHQRYPSPKPQPYQQRGHIRYQQRSHEKYQQPEKYIDRNDEPYEPRTPTPHRKSVLRSRRSRDKSSLRPQRTDVSRDKSYRQVGSGSRDPYRRYPQPQIQKLEQKYMQNIYQLNSPRKQLNSPRNGKRDDRERKDYNQRDHRQKGDKLRPQYKQRQYREQKSKGRNYVDRGKGYRDHPDRVERDYAPQGQRYRDAYRQEEWNDREAEERDIYRDDRERGYYKEARYNIKGQRPLQQRGRNHADPRRRIDKLSSNNSGKNTPGYYYQDHAPSTTVGIKTLPQISRYDSISDASIPLNSIGSHKQFPKNTLASQVPQKKSVKLDRPRQKPAKNQKERQRQKQRQRQVQQQSSLQQRWHKNQIRLQDRPADRWDVKNKKAIDEGFQPGSLPTGSVFLPVQSKRLQRNQWADDILQRIIIHLQSMNLIADYTKDFKKMYQNVQPWQVLIFLTYKKFYIQRMKVVNVLRPGQRKQSSQSAVNLEVKQNPFTLPYSKISQKQLQKFAATRQCLALVIELQSENTRIRNALRNLYNLYIQKSGEHVNMLDCDNFSDQIYRLMIEQLDGIAENLQDAQLVMPTRLRMGKIIKVGLLVAFLNGKYIKNFAQVIIHEDIIKVGKRQTLREDNISELFLAEFKRVLTS